MIDLAPYKASSDEGGLWTPRPLYKSPMPPRFASYGPEVCAWIEKHCVFPADQWLGRPFRLLPWQREWINELYAVNDGGELQYRWALLGIPKKEGKTTLAAALALYHVFGDPDELDPHAVCAATADSQADLVFGAAARMVEYSPTLSRVAAVKSKTIEEKRGPGILRRIAASKGVNDGKNISMAVLDELHEWDEINWTIITNGTVGRRRAQIIQITTAGYDLETICGSEYLKGVAIAEGRIVNPTYLFRWYAAPERMDYRDPETWRLAHPGYDIVVSEAALRDKAENTKESPFRRYFLNQWRQTEQAWLGDGMWDECADTDVTLVDGAPTWIGWDASSKRDSTAIAAVQWDGDYEELIEAVASARDEYSSRQDDDGEEEDTDSTAAIQRLMSLLTMRLLVEGRVWDKPIDPETGKPIEEWHVPVGEVETHVRKLGERFDVREIAYDPMFITWSALGFEAQGMPMTEWPQTDARMVPATGALYDMIRLRRLAHNPDDEQAAAFARHIASCVAVTTRGGGERLAKGKAKKPMDFGIALSMAVYRALRAVLSAEQRTPLVWVGE
jgi:phage terminase large subunit-like protein